MADYNLMYKKLFNAVTNAIRILQAAQVETEEIYISQEEPKIALLNLTTAVMVVMKSKSILFEVICDGRVLMSTEHRAAKETARVPRWKAIIVYPALKPIYSACIWNV